MQWSLTPDTVCQLIVCDLAQQDTADVNDKGERDGNVASGGLSARSRRTFACAIVCLMSAWRQSSKRD